tara:strand:+ start:23 stop:673 length:651 start_codon:yes stop_codon:yes gene_type:complete
MNNFLFPFSTCEKINKRGFIQQPYSAIINGISAIIVLFFLLYTKLGPLFFLFLSIFVFQIYHMFSHMVHINGNIQTNTIHIISYLVNFSLFYVLYEKSNQELKTLFLFLYIFLIILDLYAFFNLSTIYFIPTQVMLFLSLLVYYFKYLPNLLKNNLHNLIIIIFIIYGLVLNEKYNCKNMLEMFPNFPFHILIEIFGLLFFSFFSFTFYQENAYKE